MNGTIQYTNKALAVVVLIAATLLTAGCTSSEKGTEAPSTQDFPSTEAPKPAEWNSLPNKDLALHFFINGNIKEENGDFEGARRAFEMAIRHDDDPSIFAALARSHVHTGSASTALVYAQEAVERDPGKTEFRRQLAQLYMLTGENDSAAVQYRYVIEQDPSDMQARYSLAQLYDKRDPEEAILMYEDLRDRMGDDWNLSTRLAELYSKQNRLEDAARELETLLRLDPDNEVVMQTLGSLSIKMRDFDRALDMYEALTEFEPNNVSYWLGMAEIYLYRNNWTAASQAMRKALEMQSLSTEDALRIGEIYFQQAVANPSLTMEALDAVLVLHEQYPDEWKPAWHLGALMFNSGSYDNAIKYFNDALRINPGNAQVLDVLARAYMALGKYEDAIPTLRRLIVTGEAGSDAYMQLGYAYTRLGQEEDAITALKQALQIDPSNVEAVLRLGPMLDERNEFSAAQELYDRTIEEYRENNLERTDAYYVMLNNYAYALSERGIVLDRALELASIAVTKKPENPSFLDTIGWVHFRSGNMNEARIYLEKAITISLEKGTNPSAVLYHHLGDVYFELGDPTKAKENWENALERSPDNEDLIRKLQRDPQ